MNTPASAAAVTETLADVRRAYRLLYMYQRAALDAVRYIGDQFGLALLEGCTNFQDDPPGGGRGVLKYPAWRWLSLMFYDFTFGIPDGQTQEERETKLAIWLFGDTGFYLSDSATDKAAVHAFAPVEQSGTKIGVLLFRQWESKYGGAFTDKKEEVRRFLETGGELPAALGEGKVVGKLYDFSCLVEEGSTNELIVDVERLAIAHGFLLRRQPKAGK